MSSDALRIMKNQRMTINVLIWTTIIYYQFISCSDEVITNDSMAETETNRTIPPSSKIAGHRRLSREKEFPYLAMISHWNTAERAHCMGTLMTSKFVLTARRCVMEYDRSDRPTRVLELAVTPLFFNKRSHLPPDGIYAIDKIFCSQGPHGSDKYADVALIKIRRKFPTDRWPWYITGVEIAESRDDVDRSSKNIYRVPGFGANNLKWPAKYPNDYPDDLWVWEAHEKPTCESKNLTICLKSDPEGSMASGDAGAPAIAKNKKTGKDIQVGLASWPRLG